MAREPFGGRPVGRLAGAAASSCAGMGGVVLGISVFRHDDERLYRCQETASRAATGANRDKAHRLWLGPSRPRSGTRPNAHCSRSSALAPPACSSSAWPCVGRSPQARCGLEPLERPLGARQDSNHAVKQICANADKAFFSTNNRENNAVNA
jgi:hypothetical protein